MFLEAFAILQVQGNIDAGLGELETFVQGESVAIGAGNGGFTIVRGEKGHATGKHGCQGLSFYGQAGKTTGYADTTGIPEAAAFFDQVFVFLFYKNSDVDAVTVFGKGVSLDASDENLPVVNRGILSE